MARHVTAQCGLSIVAWGRSWRYTVVETNTTLVFNGTCANPSACTPSWSLCVAEACDLSSPGCHMHAQLWMRVKMHGYVVLCAAVMCDAPDRAHMPDL